MNLKCGKKKGNEPALLRRAANYGGDAGPLYLAALRQQGGFLPVGYSAFCATTAGAAFAAPPKSWNTKNTASRMNPNPTT